METELWAFLRSMWARGVVLTVGALLLGCPFDPPRPRPTQVATESGVALRLCMIAEAQRQHHAKHGIWAASLGDLQPFLADPGIANELYAWSHTFSVRRDSRETTWLALAVPDGAPGSFMAIGPDGRVVRVIGDVAAVGSGCQIPASLPVQFIPGH